MLCTYLIACRYGWDMDAQPERKPGSLADYPSSPLSGDPVPATRRPTAGTGGSSGGASGVEGSSSSSRSGGGRSSSSSEPGWQTAMQLVREQRLRLREVAAAHEWLKPVAWALRNLPRFGTCGASAVAGSVVGNLIDVAFDPFGLLGVGSAYSSDHLESQKRDSSTGSSGGGGTSGSSGSGSTSSSSASRQFISNRDRADSSGDSSAAAAASHAINELRRLMLLGAPDTLRLRAGQGAFRETAGSWRTVDVGALQKGQSSNSSLNGSSNASHGRPVSPHAPPSPLAMQRQLSYSSLNSPSSSSSSSSSSGSDLAWQPQRLNTNHMSSSSSYSSRIGPAEGDSSSSSGALSPSLEWPSMLSRLKVSVPVANVVPDSVQPFAAYRIRVSLEPPQWPKPLASAANAAGAGTNAETTKSSSSTGTTTSNSSTSGGNGNSMRSSSDRSFHRQRSSSSSSSSVGGWESAPFGAPTLPPSTSQQGNDHLSKPHNGHSQQQPRQQQMTSTDDAFAIFSATPTVR